MSDFGIACGVIGIAIIFMLIIQGAWKLSMYYEWKSYKGRIYGKTFSNYKEYIRYYRQYIRPW